MNIKQTLAMMALAGTIGLYGCGRRGLLESSPYSPIKFSEVQNNKDKKVIVEGLPSLVRKDGFILRDGTNELYVARFLWGMNRDAGDYASAKIVLEKEVNDGDEQKIKVYGVPTGDNTIEAVFIEVEDSLYSLYR